MASPPKPWERPGINKQSDDITPSSFMSGPAPSSYGLGSSLSGLSPTTGGGDAPPPVPSRSPTSGYSSYSPGNGYGGSYSSPYSYGGGGMYSSPYSSMYGGYSSGMYGSSMYGGGYGGYGMNRYGYGAQNNEYNSFARMAEESSRPAFQSIESIVGAFSSVSMMLDSTFQAVFNSFRAVIGVADNFSRMKTQFAQIFSAFALFRTIRYMYRKLLVLLRLRPQGFAEEAWTEAGDTVTQGLGTPGPGKGKSSWPVLMFFAIIMGGPWLIWKFLKSTFAGQGVGQGWATGEEDHFVGKTLYNFQAQSNDELSFQAGANIHIAPKEMQPRVKGWLLGSIDGKTVGLVPANYIKVLGKRRGTKVSNYPVNNELETFSDQSQAGKSNINSVSSLSQPSVQSGAEVIGLHQSPSAVNFENQIQTEFTRERSIQNIDSTLLNNSSPLDQVPELPEVYQNDKA